MAMYTAYYDASGSQRDPSGPMVAVGLVARKSRWTRFEREWGAMLKEHRIPKLHMKELYTGKPPYASLKGNPVRTRQLLERAASITARAVNKPFSISLDLAGYREVNREYRLKEADGGPYAFVTVMCLSVLDMWLKRRHPHQPVEHIVEDGDIGQGDLVRILRKADFAVSIKPKKKPQSGYSRPFEASDFVAWESRRILAAGKGYRLRPSAHALHRLITFNDKHFNADALRRMCAAKPDQYPLR